MSRPFSNNSAKSSFAQVKESTDAGTYIHKKKAEYTFCKSNICQPNKNIYSQSNLLLLREVNDSYFNHFKEFDKTQLYTNLYTKLDLSDLSGNTPVITDLSGNSFPVIIDTNVTPYLKYNIDPSGVLFGNTICDNNNYLNYVTYYISSNILF